MYIYDSTTHTSELVPGAIRQLWLLKKASQRWWWVSSGFGGICAGELAELCIQSLAGLPAARLWVVYKCDEVVEAEGTRSPALCPCRCQGACTA